ncbi:MULTISPECIES: hypothetical protein [Staphylococcus]|uniref:hypothetical protein n=1 Tax=Staphylococcus TaxID=1279 RepID=UPI000A61F9D1|nr:hypothetical protein [Staphylococcus saprophyticus]MDW3782160.1 hypothetical protein [Staphylococcus saprophyticus]MDW3787334.1 hypothetical protein [Staphylococcus saprophyticus]MDW3933056.1 hypothetical protein [Staphylococcus saprophyticus]MDW3953091.1 hypothetical protein [Staphylococcus saprophyticus]MDW3954928.1 hypothetical protein [Staphylococcus saprophyticus]
MITKQFIKQNLECSDVYAQKLIDYAQGDDKVLYDLFIQKLNQRRNTPAIREVK